MDCEFAMGETVSELLRISMCFVINCVRVLSVNASTIGFVSECKRSMVCWCMTKLIIVIVLRNAAIRANILPTRKIFYVNKVRYNYNSLVHLVECFKMIYILNIFGLYTPKQT